MTDHEKLKHIETLKGLEKLQAIADFDLGIRSIAARSVIARRARRKELMSKGLTFAEACLIVNTENKAS